MPGSRQSSDHDVENIQFQKGAHWDLENVTTILQWVHIAAINLDVMTEATVHYKRYIRRNTIISLIMSTLASTASLSQFNVNEQNNPTLSLVLQIFFTVMSIIIAISTGYIKVYQIQEKLEKAIKLQQEWTSFGSMLSSELQLPVNLRKDALYIIIKFKDTYNELFRQQIDISQKIIQRVAIRNGLEPYSLSLSELFERVLEGEADRMKLANQGEGGEIDIAIEDKNNKIPHSFESKGKKELNKVAKLLTGMIVPEKDKLVVNQQRQKVSNYIMKPIKNTGAGMDVSEEGGDIIRDTPIGQTPVKMGKKQSMVPMKKITEDNSMESDKNIIIVDKI